MEILTLFLLLAATVTLQAYIYNKRLFRKLDYSCTFSAKEANEGDEIFLVETVHNRKLLPLPWLKVNISTSRWLDFAAVNSTVAQEARYVTSGFFLKSYQKTTRRWYLKCLKRGVYNIDRVSLVSGDLLGFYMNSLPWDVNAQLTVYPALIDLDRLLVSASCLQGDTVVKRWIIDDPFIVAGAREYAPGDPLNRLHWQATARTGQLMSRKNDYTSQYNLTIILNVQSREHEHESVIDKELIELGIKAAATLLDRALRMGIPARLASNGCTVEDRDNTIFTGEAAGRDHITSLLKLLATLQIRNVKYFEGFLEEISYSVKNSQVVLITCYMNENINASIRVLRSGGNEIRLIALNYIDPNDIPPGIDVFYVSGADKPNA